MINDLVMQSFCKYAEDSGIGKKLVGAAIGAGVMGAAGHFLGPQVGSMIGKAMGRNKMSWLPVIGKPIGGFFGSRMGARAGTQYGAPVGAAIGALGGVAVS